jgi:hypothetical protein
VRLNREDIRVLSVPPPPFPMPAAPASLVALSSDAAGARGAREVECYFVTGTRGVGIGMRCAEGQKPRRDEFEGRE